MKLSEAILKGSEMVLPNRGELIELGYEDEILSACALGAALVGTLGIQATIEAYNADSEDNQLTQLYPVLRQPPPPQLPDARSHLILHGWVVHNNDELGLSREEIAEKLREVGL